MFRLVWGGNRLAWRHGRWEDKDEHGVLLREVIEPRLVPKYGWAKERFHIEVWHPAEYYGTPTEWEVRTTTIECGVTCSTLGEYPSRGDYEWIDTIEQTGICECGKLANEPCKTCGKMSSYMEPTREYLRFFIQAWRRSTDKVNQAFAKAAAIARGEKEQADRAKHYEDRVRDALPAFGGAAHAVIGAPN